MVARQNTLLTLLMAGLLSACSGGTGMSGAAVKPGSPIRPTDLYVPTPTPDPQAAAARLALEAFARDLGITPDRIRVEAVRAMSWPNTAMGCPAPGKHYPAVITNGFGVQLAAADARADYHVSDGSLGPVLIVRCDSQPTPSPDWANEAVQVAMEAFAGAENVSTEEIRLVEVTATSWPNAAMGCPKPGLSYSPVVTDGFVVRLAAGDVQAEYHVRHGSLGPPQSIRCGIPLVP